MTTLVILAHPNLEKSIANKTIINELKTQYPDLEIRELSKLYPDYKINIKNEQEALLRHQNIVVQYPFYWYSMPAILKLWFDEVFEHQFAYGSKGDKLRGKNFIPSFTVGSSESSYTALGFQHFRVHEFCKHLEQTAYHTQMKYIDPVHCYETSLAAGHTEEEIISNAREHAKKLIKKLTHLENNNLAINTIH
ncbi:flavodoxin family protein [Chryseobacterium sp. G0240]|uniref:NAD(P)H-dependent oxidoreductase n=1 Tax=Chryseobacterium sp. G0240 TaxID=2487066 RepID=UPI000F453F5E|nr:NAD(P)H-dependent oxidoreductase [Chryseobacterium sp. G0240]ROI06553.1 flavodoxin family protein [Chryseobacterium sp. G0240]